MPSIARRLGGIGLLAPLLLPPALSGCMVGPDYHRAPTLVPARFKEMPPPPGWAYADPHFAELPKGAWWRIYNDPVLDRLESRIDISNQTVKADEAAFRQARALVDEARAGLFPTASVTPSVTRQGSGGNGGSITTIGGSGFAGTTAGTGATTGTLLATGGERDVTNYSLSGTVDWEVDVWGSIRRQIESQVAAAQLSQATLDAARLSEQTTLAIDYFQLRYQDSLRTLLQQFVDFYDQSAQITRNSYRAGVSAPSDLLQAETLVAQTRAQLVSVDQLRAQYEHAIAVLTGVPPAELDIAPAALTDRIPAVPVTVPSTLLQRRPDIAEAERAMEEENALIGVAIAAFFPTISL
ncbi:MAG: efflux transporter outer membrane subunit, partial [Gluconacetobacter diazotrophicus]|nr:efflux transporter outer membrane subunit [Gluconacetobacter diazotrophicus]